MSIQMNEFQEGNVDLNGLFCLSTQSNTRRFSLSDLFELHEARFLSQSEILLMEKDCLERYMCVLA